MQLIAITEHRSLIEQHFEPGEPYQPVWDFYLNLLSDDEQDLLEVLILVVCRLKEDKDKTMISFKASHIFKVDDIERFYYNGESEEFAEQEKLYLASLVGISMSGIRGMVYSRSFPVYGNKLFIPIVNPMALSSSIKPLRHIEELIKEK
jgi:hypothetical protein